MTLSEELQWRGFINQTTLEDITALDTAKWTFYFGVDPSAPSMTIGNLASMLLVRHLLKHGHEGYLLIGGATGLIGDPDGKKDERQLKTREEIDSNKANIVRQYDTILQGLHYQTVDNYDWFKGMSYLEFLRDIGKHVPMRQMLGRDFVQTRLRHDGAGISYAEFSYVLIQAYDFMHLNREYGVTLQLCGSDQWGNSIAGVDLNRRLNGSETHVLSMPLVIDKTTGKKFGKSEAGAVWLDAARTSIYRFYQFWLNIDDEGTEDYLKIYTELNKGEIDEVMRKFNEDPAARLAQKTLAYEVTKLVHGQDKADSVVRVTNLLFGNQPASEVTADDAEVLRTELANVDVSENALLTEALTASGLAASKSEARRMIEQGAVRVNGEKLTDDRALTADDRRVAGSALLQRGKNKFALVDIK